VPNIARNFAWEERNLRDTTKVVILKVLWEMREPLCKDKKFLLIQKIHISIMQQLQNLPVKLSSFCYTQFMLYGL
jgi:hypothetical protein